MFPNINSMKIYLVCDKTDLRKGIDGLAALVIDMFDLDVYDNAIFLFCGTRADRFKSLYWDKTGFVLYYKRIENGRFQWPGNQSEVKKINAYQLRRLLDGFSVEEKKTILPCEKGLFY
jgi:transposase